MKFKVQIIESFQYNIEVEADDDESAVEQAYEIYGDYENNDQGEYLSSEADLVTNLDTGEKYIR